MGPSRHITVSLNQTNVAEALQALAAMPKHLKVRTVRVHADTPIHKKEILNIANVFKVLSTLRNFTEVTMDLNYMIALPLKALAIILEGRKLTSLQLSKLQFSGTEQDLRELRPLLQAQTSLQTLTIRTCRGSAKVVNALLLDPPSLSKVEVTSTAIVSVDEKISSNDAIVQLLRSSPDLKTLSLIDLPLGQISHDHIKAMAAELSWKPTQLQELKIVSSLLDEESGKAISNMLLFNKTIQTVTLHLDWEDSGFSIAKMLRVNKTLEGLDLRVYGDEGIAAESVVELARALRGDRPSTGKLRKLRLSFEFDPQLLPEEVFVAFSETLECNDRLSKLILTDSIVNSPLPIEMRTAIRLNRLGIPALLREQADVASIHETVVDAIISSRNDIHVVHNLLSNYPILCMSPVQENVSSRLPQTAVANGDKLKNTSLTAFGMSFQRPAVKQHSSSKKAFGRRVRALFAPSA